MTKRGELNQRCYLLAAPMAAVLRLDAILKRHEEERLAILKRQKKELAPIRKRHNEELAAIFKRHDEMAAIVQRQEEGEQEGA